MNTDSKKATSKSITKPKRGKLIKNKIFFLQRFELYANMGGYVKGAIITLKCHKSTKRPMDPYWRRRFSEADMDGCMTKAAPVKPVKDKEKENNDND